MGNTEIKIKPKSPKSAKPSSKGDKEIKVDFCKIRTDDRDLVNNLLFDVEDFKQVRVNHTLMINEIVVSDELKAEANGDFKIIKEMAKRKGKIIRKLVIDEEESSKEKEFEAWVDWESFINIIFLDILLFWEEDLNEIIFDNSWFLLTGSRMVSSVIKLYSR